MTVPAGSASVDALERAVTQVINDARSRSDQVAAGGGATAMLRR